MSALILQLSLSQTPVFLLNSRLGLFSAASFEAPLLPKLRGHFAEFLNKSSLVRLRILSSPTCVGLRYGHPYHCQHLFSPAGIHMLRYLFSLPIKFQPYAWRTSLPSSLRSSTGSTINRLMLSFCVNASLIWAVQESQPVFHRLRLSSSA